MALLRSDYMVDSVQKRLLQARLPLTLPPLLRQQPDTSLDGSSPFPFVHTRPRLFLRDRGPSLCSVGYSASHPVRSSGCPVLRSAQVEANTIAASFGGLSPLVTRLHAEMVQRHGLSGIFPADCLPKNDSVEGLARGLAGAWREVRKDARDVEGVGGTCAGCAGSAGGPYKRIVACMRVSKGISSLSVSFDISMHHINPSASARLGPLLQAGDASAAVLMVVSPGERNWVDQQWLQVPDQY